MLRAQRHLRSRQRAVSGRTGEIWRDGARLAADITFVPTQYNSIVKHQEDTDTSSDIHVWLVGVDQVAAEPEEGDEYRIANPSTGTVESFRVSRDDVTEKYWQWHGHSQVNRVVFTVLWEE